MALKNTKIANLIKPACYRTAGIISFALLNEDKEAITALKPVGNASGFTFTPDVQKISQKGYMDGTNSIICSENVSSDVTVSIDVTSVSVDNLSKILYGEVTEVEGETDLALAITAKLGGSTKLGTFISSATVKSSDDLKTFEEGKNYELSGSTIYIYSTEEQTAKGAAELIAESDVLNLTVNTTKHTIVDAMQKSKILVAAYFEGMNMSNGSKALAIDVPCVEIDPSEFNFLSPEEYGSLTITGQVIKVDGVYYNVMIE